MLKVSTIMPSFLGEYPGSASHKNQKFMRAVNSFINCHHDSSELIVASDGCEITIELLEKHFKKELASGLIKLLKLERHPLFTGEVRQKAIDAATGEILCNLDTDDAFMPHHLHNIANAFNTSKYDWCYFSYNRILDELQGKVVELIPGDINDLCTANVIWKRGLDVTWSNCDGRQDNKSFNKQLIEKYPRVTKIYGCGYEVRHALISKL